MSGNYHISQLYVNIHSISCKEQKRRLGFKAYSEEGIQINILQSLFRSSSGKRVADDEGAGCNLKNTNEGEWIGKVALRHPIDHRIYIHSSTHGGEDGDIS